METNCKTLHWLERAKSSELWAELGRRLEVNYGRVEMVFHQGKPSKYATVDQKVIVEESEVKKTE